MLKITVGDDTYSYDGSRVTLKMSRLLKQQSGLDIPDVTMGRLSDPRVLTAIIWLCRYDDGEHDLQFDDIDAPLATIGVTVESEADGESPTSATLPDNGSGSPTDSTD